MEKNEIFPGGPTCKIEGKIIPPFITCSPHRGITSPILSDILKWIDHYNIFERGANLPTPCVLLDVHSSRLELPFLKYTTNPNQQWSALIGIPYGTSIW